MFCGVILFSYFILSLVVCILGSWQTSIAAAAFAMLESVRSGGSADRIPRVLNVSNSNCLPCRRVHNVHIVIC